MRRTAVIFHITSMPGGHGTGDILAAMKVARWAAYAGLDLQLLPLTDPADGICPYTGKSAFARNPLLISLDMLVEDGLLAASDLQSAPSFPEHQVNFHLVHTYKSTMLKRAYANWKRNPVKAMEDAYSSFVNSASYWIHDYALYVAIKDRSHGAPWCTWDKDLAERNTASLAQTREELIDIVEEHMFYQFLFAYQWAKLRALCRSLGVRLIGDMPIFVGHEFSRCLGPSIPFQAGGRSPTPGRCRRAARLFQQGRATLGQPALRMGGYA